MRMSSRDSCAVAPSAALIASLLALLSASAAEPQPASVEELVSAVVRINTHITPDGRTVQGLGREREGSGILIDADGLILTIGYLMVEAYAAEVVDNSGRTVPANVVGYDHETGFGLLRTIEPLKLKPMPLGKSAEIREGDPVLIASFGGPAMVGGAYVVAKREFAGSWEYLLDEALFTAPRFAAFDGHGTEVGAKAWGEGADLGHAGAIDYLAGFLRDHREGYELSAVGHRVVHGGMEFSKAVRVTVGRRTASQSMPLAR